MQARMLHEVFSEDNFAAGLTISDVITRTDAVC